MNSITSRSSRSPASPKTLLPKGVDLKTFRPYQLDASRSILSTWQKHRTCIATVATGGGKTLIAAGTTKYLVDKGARVLFLANRNELCTQPFYAFQDQGLSAAFEKAESKAPLHANVVIGSVQSLTRKSRLDRFPKDHFTHIFADECHGALAESWKRIFTHFDQARVCGITATPFRADGKELSEIFEVEAFRKDLFSLVDEGFLVDPTCVEKLSTAISLANVRIKRTPEGKDFDVNDSAEAIEPYFREIAKEIKTRFNDRHILAFLPLVASSEKFVKACLAEGIVAVHVDGEDPQRDQKLQAFREGRITLLSNSNLLHTGIDAPACDATLCLRPTKSKVLYCQIIGRSTRTAPGTIDGLDTVEERLAAIKASAKSNAIVLDPMWLSSEHDLCTPSFLIAADQEQAEEMAKATAGKHAYSLRAVRTQIQEEREAAVLRRLERVASFRDRTVNAKWFAASIKDHALVNYQAVYSKEKQPTTKFSKLLLEKAGIDPQSVTSEGEAREVLRAIGQRRHKGLCELPDLAGAVEVEGVSDKIWQLTKAEARRAA
jgi:superfamily II DNA or RNA helicase